MQSRLIQAIPILLIGLFAFGTAIADSSKQGDSKEDRYGRWLQELNLNPEQQEQLKAIKEKYHAEMKQQKKAMKDARKSLQTALQSDASEASLRSQFKAMQEKRAQFATLRFEKILAIRAILTPEQRKKFQGMRKHHRRHHDH